jgi:hypothetical protein
MEKTGRKTSKRLIFFHLLLQVLVKFMKLFSKMDAKLLWKYSILGSLTALIQIWTTLNSSLMFSEFSPEVCTWMNWLKWQEESCTGNVITQEKLKCKQSITRSAPSVLRNTTPLKSFPTCLTKKYFALNLLMELRSTLLSRQVNRNATGLVHLCLNFALGNYSSGK